MEPPDSNKRGIAGVVALALLALGLLAAPSRAQLTEYRLDPDGQWTPSSAPDPASDEGIMNRARELLAADQPEQAIRLLDAWIDENENKDNPWFAEALLLRGDAKTLAKDEFDALYDYERVIKEFPASDAFTRAVQSEQDTGIRYVNGYRRKWWFGWRIEDAKPIGEELLIRSVERMPGSRLAERSLIELADFYYRERELRLAAEAYDVFLTSFPTSEFRQHAIQRRVFSNIGRFKGPEYDASGLVEARVLIEDFAGKFPAEAEKAGLSDALLARLDESAAAQLLNTAEWYIRRSDAVSARLVVRRLISKHPGTAAAERGRQLARAQSWTFADPLAPAAPDSASESTPQPASIANEQEPAP
ncbi:MAG: outer membrane protein assembly factor BamD [Planctomycetota bacterium]|nr:outer membrane protein assembly factor BamD [Planctomycetota bacterium]